MANLRPFMKVDWYGWSGAERFDDGSEPLISPEGLPVAGWPEPLGGDFDGTVVAILDRTGLSLNGRDGCLHLDADRAVAQEIADLLFAARGHLRYRALVALGFEPCNLPLPEEVR